MHFIIESKTVHLIGGCAAVFMASHTLINFEEVFVSLPFIFPLSHSLRHRNRKGRKKSPVFKHFYAYGCVFTSSLG